MIKTQKTSKKPLVDFDDLDELEPGDAITVHFKSEEPRDVRYLLRLLSDGVVALKNSNEKMIIDIILRSGDWGGNANQYIELLVGEGFSRVRFEDALANRIDKLVVQRQRPLVDLSVLEVPGASVRYRFRLDGIAGVIELYDFFERSLIDLGSPDHLIEAFVLEVMTEKARCGHFTNHLDGVLNAERRRIFASIVAPHLELLRP